MPLISLGQAAPFNLFALGDAIFINGNVGGKIAAAGDFTATSFGMANGFGPPTCLGVSPNSFSLIVGDDLNFSNGQLTCGSYAVGDTIFSSPSLGQAGATGQVGNILALTGINFPSASVALNLLNDQLCASPAGLTVPSNGQLTFSGTAAPVQFFRVLGPALAGVNTINFFIPNPNAVVIIDVQGGPVFFQNLGMNLNGFPPQNLLWNFCGTTQITIQSVNFQGSILAPDALLTLTSAPISGQVIANAFSSTSGGNLNNILFVGVNTCTATSTTATPL